MENSNINYTSLSDNNNLRFEINYFYNLDSENKICFDCGGAFPRFVSINNGVLICEFCAENHKQNLNYNISFIYDTSSIFDQYLLSFVTRGGNSRFKRLCLQYEIPCMSLSQNNSEKINKYVIRLGEYHRLLLKSEIDCSEPPPPLYREIAHNPIDVNIIYFPEFENYRPYTGSIIKLNNNNEINKEGNNEDESMASKIWEGTKTTFDVMKTTTGFIYNTSKPIVSFIGNAAFTGLKYLGNSVWNYYMNNNENSENKDNNNNKNENIIGNNTPINANNGNNINNNFGNTNNGGMNNNFNYNNFSNNYNEYNNNNSNLNNNKNYLANSNKFNIFTINEDKPYQLNNQKNMNNYPNQTNNIYSKPMYNTNNNNNNQIPNYYDINSINNESVNNISFYLNNNNNNINSINNISKMQKSLLNHENIIINNKYINKNNLKINNNNIINSNPDKINNNLPNNAYPNYSVFEKNMIMEKNIPNIVGEEIYQEQGKYPIYQPTNVGNNNEFSPSDFNTKNED